MTSGILATTGKNTGYSSNHSYGDTDLGWVLSFRKQGGKSEPKS